MASSTLTQFISTIEANGSLSRIAVSVDPILEIATITNRVCKQVGGGMALLFEHPTGSTFQIATNLFGSEKRVCTALAVSTLDELTVRMSTLLKRIPELEVTSLDSQIAALPEFIRFAPHEIAKSEPDMILMDPPDLTRFPFLQSWPGDGEASGHGRYITLPQVFTADLDGDTPNCGVYRVQLLGEREVAIQWKAGSGAARHAEQYRHAGKPMPVAIVLGSDPMMLFSAMFPLPGDLDEMTFAGFLRGLPFDTVPCTTVPLRIPTGAEVVIEGYVEPRETVMEGPFGNHTGFYSPAAPAALMRITAIRHRSNAIIPATVVGPPPMEDCWMAQAWERLLLAFLRRIVPSIKDIHFPFEWIFHQSAIISLENPQPGMVRNISAQLWAISWFAAAKVLLFVTADAKTTDLSHVAWKIINVTDFSKDIIHDKATARIAVDATGCDIKQKVVSPSAETLNLIAARWKEYGLA
jgi:4-hydroxy-3-polyprenylbenzoate decarboxylase